MLSTINLDLINPDAAAPGEWIEIYKGAGNCLCSEAGREEWEEDCDVTVSIKMNDGKPILICLAPSNAELSFEVSTDLDEIGWQIDNDTWHQPDSEDCVVAQVGELGDRLESTPYIIEWEEFSAWRYESIGGPQVYDHQDPQIEPDVFNILSQYAFDCNITNSSMNHRRVACELMVPADKLEAAQALLVEQGVTCFSTEEVKPENTPFHLVDDAGFGAIVRYTGKYWTWEKSE